MHLKSLKFKFSDKRICYIGQFLKNPRFLWFQGNPNGKLINIIYTNPQFCLIILRLDNFILMYRKYGNPFCNVILMKELQKLKLKYYKITDNKRELQKKIYSLRNKNNYKVTILLNTSSSNRQILNKQIETQLIDNRFILFI